MLNACLGQLPLISTHIHLDLGGCPFNTNMGQLVYSHRRLILVTLLAFVFQLGSCRRPDGEPASHQAVARRQDGVFFGLGGLDARSMPFDLDAFFEYAAPTRTTRLSSTASPRKQSDRSSSAARAGTVSNRPPVPTSRSSPSSDGGHFDSFEEDFQSRRRPTVTSTQHQQKVQQSFVSEQSPQSLPPAVASLGQGRSPVRQQQVSNRAAFPLHAEGGVRTLPQSTAQSVPAPPEPRAQTFATPTRLAALKEGQGFRARTHNTASVSLTSLTFII